MSAQGDLLRTVTKVSAALNDAGIRFALTGGCAVYARGGPETEHDVDVLVKREDIEDAVRALVAQGMRAAPPPEDWLTKVYDGDRLVDLLFRPNERPVTDTMLDSSELMRVGPATVPVQSATEVIIGKLLAMGTHRGDLNEPMQSARALREQIDWSQVAVQTAHSPYAEAFLLLARRLGVIPKLTRIPADRSEDDREEPA